MANMKSDLTDLKDYLQMISSVHSADIEYQNQQPYRETIPLDNLCLDEQPAEIPSPRIVNAEQPATVTNPMIYAVQPAAVTNPMCMADGMQQHSPPFAPRTIPCINSRYSKMNSEEIPGSGLKSIPEVLLKYPDLHSECKIGKLAVKLAQEAVFGDAVLQRCTPKGWQDMPALPQRELNILKTALYKNLPCYWSYPEGFEKKWTITQEAIAQPCKWQIDDILCVRIGPL